MKIVVLSQDCEVNGVDRVKGEVVKVPDDFEEELIKKVIKEEPNVQTE